jgi:hypothetical protein
VLLTQSKAFMAAYSFQIVGTGAKSDGVAEHFCAARLGAPGRLVHAAHFYFLQLHGKESCTRTSAMSNHLPRMERASEERDACQLGELRRELILEGGVERFARGVLLLTVMPVTATHSRGGIVADG